MDFVLQIGTIILMDLVLSGDNAVVIGMAAHRLDPRQRKQAIIIGGAAACAIRIALTLIAALLLQVKGLQLIGGVLLLWIGIKLLRQEEDCHSGVKAAGTLGSAVTTILVADFIMSVDNVLAVAAAAKDHKGLLVFGLVFSMAILMFMGNLVAELINKAWWLAYVGSGVIAWTAAEMIFKDPLVHSRLHSADLVIHTMSALVTAATLAVAHFWRVKQSA
jgi:YjbE family integral membrane protein